MSGWQMDRKAYSDFARQVFYTAVDHRRSFVGLPSGAERGVRFRNNDAVLARVEQQYSEEEFMKCPGPSIDYALVDAAQSDYWYNHEKDYENEEACECGEEDIE